MYTSHLLSTTWSGHPVGFDLLTHGDYQFAAFYDADRNMTVASRHLGSTDWTLAHPQGVWLEQRGRLSSQLAWDSHNYVTLAIDSLGYLHLSGNMHVDPLIYFRTTVPLDVTTFEQVDFMTGELETRCTYPVFITGPAGELVFRYRDGSSGNGNDIYNVYEAETRTWRRLVDVPLTDGQGLMNAYAHPPLLGPDGWYHMNWVWRDTPDCATNHDLSYARSRDLLHWETGDGRPLTLPITLQSGAIIDPVPAGAGIINMVQDMGLDALGRPVIAYTKYDEDGNSQVYCARLEDGHWAFYQLTHWDYRWAFQGGGCVIGEIALRGLTVQPDGGLALPWEHVVYGRGVWKLAPDTLEIIGSYPFSLDDLPEDLATPTLAWDGPIEVHWLTDRGTIANADKRYALRWETRPEHRDRPYEDGAPAPSELRVYELPLG